MITVIIEILDLILNNATFAVIIGGSLAGLFGFRQYRIQKIRENIDKRYFNEGLEDLISYLHFLRSSVEDNYDNCLRVIKYYRECDDKSFLEWFDKTQKSIDSRILSAKIPNSLFIVSSKIKNDHFNKMCIAIFAEIANINDYYISDIIIGLVKTAREPDGAKLSKEEIIEIGVSEARKRHERLYKKLGLYNIIETLEEILFELRKKDIDSYEKLESNFKSIEVENLLKPLEKYKVS